MVYAVVPVTTTMGSDQASSLAWEDTTDRDTQWATGEPGDMQNNTSTEGLMVKAMRLWPFQVGLAMQKYYLGTIVPIGIVGNCLTLSVLLQAKNRYVSCYVYMTGLAVSDLLLMGLALYYWLVTELLTKGWTLWECKMLVWLFHTLTTNGTWVVVAMTVDRCIAVTRPLHAAVWCRPGRAYVTVTLVAVCVTTYCVPHVLYTSVLESGTSCAAFTSSSGHFGMIYTWASLLTGCLLPFSTILVLNVKIIAAVRRHAGERSGNGRTTSTNTICAPPGTSVTSLTTISSTMPYTDYSPDPSPQVGGAEVKVIVPPPSPTPVRHAPDTGTGSMMTSRDRQLCIMLLSVTFALLVLTLPQYIRYIVYEIVTYREDSRAYAYYVMAFHVTQKLYYTNSAINFFLYCLSGSRFRSDLKGTLTYFCRRD